MVHGQKFLYRPGKSGVIVPECQTVKHYIGEMAEIAHIVYNKLLQDKAAHHFLDRRVTVRCIPPGKVQQIGMLG